MAIKRIKTDQLFGAPLATAPRALTRASCRELPDATDKLHFCRILTVALNQPQNLPLKYCEKLFFPCRREGKKRHNSRAENGTFVGDPGIASKRPMARNRLNVVVPNRRGRVRRGHAPLSGRQPFLRVVPLLQLQAIISKRSPRLNERRRPGSLAPCPLIRTTTLDDHSGRGLG